MVGILEPQYRVSEVQGKVLTRDSAAKSLIPERKRDALDELEGQAEKEEVKA